MKYFLFFSLFLFLNLNCLAVCEVQEKSNDLISNNLRFYQSEDVAVHFNATILTYYIISELILNKLGNTDSDIDGENNYQKIHHTLKLYLDSSFGKKTLHNLYYVVSDIDPLLPVDIVYRESYFRALSIMKYDRHNQSSVASLNLSNFDSIARLNSNNEYLNSLLIIARDHVITAFGDYHYYLEMNIRLPKEEGSMSLGDWFKGFIKVPRFFSNAYSWSEAVMVNVFGEDRDRESKKDK